MATGRIADRQLLFLANRSQLPMHQAKGLSVDGNSDLLFMLHDGSAIKIWVNDCPHNHRPLHYLKDQFLSADGSHIVCYAHSAHFDKHTGYCFAGPCQGQYLRSIPHIEIGDAIYIDASHLSQLRD